MITNRYTSLYLLQERYADTFTDFIASKHNTNDSFTEKVIIDYCLQFLSALTYLHSRKFISAPGALNGNNVFFTQMYDEVLIDVGRSASSISPEWLLQNSQQLLSSRKYSILCFL